MQITNQNELDKFEAHLESMIQKVQECQQNKTLDSCSKCEQYLGCQLREDYVKSVYNSMSKGDTGGFEF
ncbi:hypothetical protein FJR48_05915 [Sulfurimonas lithotrophica]|uniref:Uncharacterized protein n=1 Tax=Sulfurimonas lithotrophica TaxID=2590022 RepID=A0A5P8P0N7_9BACT|nr:hypothetical protein [Sulfurimonas lithotrophica]QFR49286.1 hypothetical protein FJR48_05915 [Sulfurimonas lithotrophica]